jgi:Nif-specific regulatory protein
MDEREPAGAPLADLLDSMAAFGRAMQETFDPQRFLAPFSARIQRVLPHDRMIVAYLEDEGRTFTMFAEHAATGLPNLHEQHYTTIFDPAGRYVAAEWALARVFAGESLWTGDLPGDPRFADPGSPEWKIAQAGLRSVLTVPLRSGDRIIGALGVALHTPDGYTEASLAVARRIAELIGPLIENTVLLHRERRRRRRLRALEGFAGVLSASLDVQDVFARLADAVRPVLDFDLMGVCLVTESGRDLEVLAEVKNFEGVEAPARSRLEDFSFSGRVEGGEVVVIHDVPAELDPSRPGDRRMIEGGARASVIVPLRFGERVGGALYFGKRLPYWFDRSDGEVASGIAAQLVLALQHQRLAEEQRRLALAQGQARRLERKVETLEEALGTRYGFDRIVGRAPALREALDRAARVAPTETTVLLTGESGTGKELVARAIHHASRRADGPFVAVNCAALPETLLESELFGHERGAFTGADRQRAGRFEQAAGGTLFLDEVGELSPAVQAKLLRVLQEREFQRLGGSATLPADVRVVTATNRDLARAVADGRFRPDLFYRLDVFTVHLPPLRERGDDVLLLADHYVRDLGARMGKGEPGLSRDARDALLAHRWPGNIRELANAVERALIVSDGGLITPLQLGLGPPAERAARDAPGPDGGPALPASLPEWERQMVVDALARAKGNKSRAARLLGLTRSQLYTRMKRFGLDG